MRVYSSPDMMMVGHMKNLLEMEGIPCEVRGQYKSAAGGQIPPIECWVELWVIDESRVEEALEIIDEAIYSDDAHNDRWICLSCKETIEGQFAVCWKCGKKRPQKKDT